MTTLVTDPTATIKSTTYENALYELLTLIRTYELKLATDPGLIDFTIDNDFLFSGSFTLPVSTTLDTNTGSSISVGIDYLGNTVYSKGVNTNTLKSSNIVAALVELLNRIQLLESNTSKNPSGINNITFQTTNDGTSFEGTFSITVIPTFNDDGSLKYIAKEYLL